MFRTCEKLLLGGLLSTGMWLGAQSFAQEIPPQANDPFGGMPKQGFQAVDPSGAVSPLDDVNRRRVSDHLKQARLRLQQGQRDEALRLTARAAQIAKQFNVVFGPNEMTPQKMVAEITGHSDTLVAGTGAAKMPVTGEAQAQKEQVQKLLREAQQEIADGQYESARSKIEIARKVEVEYTVFDVRPENLLAELARRQPARPEGPSDMLADLTKAPAANPMIRPQGVPAAAEPANARVEARQLLSAAKSAYAQGHFNEARDLALQAQRKDTTWDLLEDSPELLLTEIERQTKKQVIAAAPPASEAHQDAQQTLARALNLLKEARVALADGKFDLAQAKANEAQSLNASYSLFDDRPDLVLQDARMLQARNTNGAVPSEAIAATQPMPAAAGAVPQTQRKEQASALLNQAREAMRQGDLASAEKLVEQADSFDVAFGLFEDNPEVVREDLHRLVAARSGTTPRGVMGEAAPATLAQSRESVKVQSMKLLQAAREDLQAGRVDDARKKATQAAGFDTTYDLFEDSPERLLSDIESAAKASLASQMPAAAPAGEDQLKLQAQSLLASAREDLQAGRVDSARQKAAQAATLDVAYDLFEDSPERLMSDLGRGNAAGMEVAQAAHGLDLTAEARTASAGLGVPAARDRMVMNSNGMSAQELFDHGVAHLRNGNREGAYESFLMAYNSGEKLDSYRQQQLQDKLRELSPRRRNIQQASNESASAERLDAVAEQRSVQFDKIRTECLNAIFRAEKLRDKQPEQAVALLDQTLENIAAAELSPEQSASLTTWVKSSRGSIESYMAQRAPVIELERKNAETKDLIERQIQTRVRVEQELANLVQKFNDLMEQKRFAEADAVAKQAAALDSENPAVVNMGLKSKFAMRDHSNKNLKDAKETSFWEQLDAVEWAAVNQVARDDTPLAYPENWDDIVKTRKKRPADAREHTEAEMRVRNSLMQPVSLHFNNAPLSEVLKYIADTQGINVMVDEPGLTEEAVTSSTPISINVDGIRLKSALNLILEPLNLGYTIQNEVLNVTSRMRRQGGLETVVYQVADLVVPVSMNAPVSRLNPGSGYGGETPSIAIPKGLQNVSATPDGQNGFAQVAAMPGIPSGGVNPSLTSMSGEPVRSLNGPSGTSHGFEALTQLITSTVSPEAWQESAGAGSINQHDSTMSLVIRQTQAVHQEVADLLDQLRRLQDLQVTIEVRFITVSDQFFEQIGIDFDFNINDTIGGPSVNNNFSPMRPFGSVDPIFGGTGSSGSSGAGGGSGGSSGSSGGAVGMAPFGQGPTLNMQDRDSWPSRTVVGLLNNNQTFSPTLDVPFRQGSFDLSNPTFGGFDPNAGISFGMAILSDIEAFMFVRAAQGDRRSNVMFAPKVTLFNGQTGTVTSMTQRPFVMSLTPVASAFNIGYQPQISVIGDGTSLTVQAVVSADRRYVRLSVLPLFQNVTDVFTFSYLSAGGTGGNGNTGFGGGGGGNTGNFGGGGTGGGGTGIGGGGSGNNSSSAAGTVTVQQPVVAVVSVSTVVSVPDGGTVLLGGVKSLREGRNMAGVPILNKIPYISRLFKNTGVGRETTSLMMMVTPRIIIQEEQEQLLGIPQ